RVQRGFETAQIVTTDLKLPATRYNNVEAAKFLKALADSARAMPGVTSAGISDRLPLSGEGGNSALMLEGTTVPRFQRPIASLQLADAGYFRTLGIPLLSGRLFEEADRRRTPVAVVARATAERVWPNENAIGRRFRIGPDDSPLIEVVGIVGDVRGVSLDSNYRLNVYIPYWQVFVGQASLSVRTASDPAVVVPALRAAVRRLDSELAVPAFRTMDQVVAESVTPRRFQMTLVLLFAVTALLLSSIGIYGTASHAVTQRTNEIGIRMALGAHPARIRWMVLAQGLTPVTVGIGGGFAISFVSGTVLRKLLFGISPTDVTTFAAAGLFLAATALLAHYVPARRATRV
ncbi:MAG TPA: FtsX-like permease family protein, partial [Planctomycetaceae bacterium]|nr:FtsX-like permease family protein [Planctomycetaceae bacterium]